MPFGLVGSRYAYLQFSSLGQFGCSQNPRVTLVGGSALGSNCVSLYHIGLPTSACRLGQRYLCPLRLDN